MLDLRTIGIVLAVATAACDVSVETKKEKEMGEIEYLGVEEYAAQGLPFPEAVRAGDMLILSGQVGNLPGKMELAAGGISGETEQMMENIKATVEKYGSSMDRIAKCTVFLADMSEWSSFNDVYVRYFSPGHLPARSALGAAGLALGARVEMECIAIL